MMSIYSLICTQMLLYDGVINTFGEVLEIDKYIGVGSLQYCIIPMIYIL